MKKDKLTRQEDTRSKPASNTRDNPDSVKQKTTNAQSNEVAAAAPNRSRRAFLGKAATVTAAASVIGVPSLIDPQRTSAQIICPPTLDDGCLRAPLTGTARANAAHDRRVAAADYERNMPIPSHPCNLDEQDYANRNYFASYTKGLPHPNQFGEVDSGAYRIYLDALVSGDPDKFEDIPLGPCIGPTSEAESRLAPQALIPGQQRRLTSPQAGYNFDLEGKDYHQLNTNRESTTSRCPVAFPVAFKFNSPEEAVEIVENYWQALTRDVPFINYTSNPLVDAAADDLNSYGTAYKGPRDPLSGTVTDRVYSRGVLPGDVLGPFISQFLLLGPIPYGAQTIDQRIRTAAAGTDNDFMTDFGDWRTVQNGCAPSQTTTFDPTRRRIRSGRDLAEYVRNDAIYQAYLNAALLMITPESMGGLEVPLDPNNPYLSYRKQDNFVEFGVSQLLTLLGEVSVRAHKAVWFQKWQVHRRLRPEEFGGRIHFWRTDPIARARYPINPIINNSEELLVLIGQTYGGNFFLPQAYPEGSPVHPAYGAGHATLAGACVTILKAWFDESARFSRLFQASSDGLSLPPYTPTAAESVGITIGTELNKLASNISIGRNIAGVHWRSDYTESVYLGEQVAIQLLEDYGFTYNEDFDGFRLTDFSGNPRVIGAKRTP